jgi:aspartokinase
MQRNNLGGIKLLKECCRFTTSGNIDEELLPLVTSRMAESRLNISFLSHLANNGEGLSITTFTTESVAEQLVCDCLKPIMKSPADQHSFSNATIVSVFPHDQKPEVAGTLVNLLARKRIHLFGLGSSPSSLSIIVSPSEVPAIIDALFHAFEFPTYRSPYDWYAAYQGQEQVLKEIIGSYQEQVLKAFYIIQETELDLWTVLLGEGHLPAFAEALRKLADRDVKLPYITGHRLPSSDILFSLCFCHSQNDAVTEVFTACFAAPIAVCNGPIGLFHLHGPHFIDRYGIADALVKSLQQAAVTPVALSCTLSSISLVVDARNLDAAGKALERGFHVPTTRAHRTA